MNWLPVEGSNLPTAVRLTLLIALATATSGCAVIGDIFKAGVWVGVLLVVVVIGLVFAILGRVGS